MAGVALLTLHGMGRVEKNYEVPLVTRLRQELTGAEWDELSVVSVQYQTELQAHQEAVWQRMHKAGPLGSRFLRQFLLYGFSDAASLEHSRDDAGSVYEQTQALLLEGLRKAYAKVGPDGHVVVAAYSLGAEVISSYLWDASRDGGASAGVWRHPKALGLDPDEESFCRGARISHLVTFGCNIPIFVAGIDPLVPIPRPNPDFRWINLYDKDDPLGWPLGPLSDAYAALVTDIPVEAASSFVEAILGATPLSHLQYWTDDEVVALVAGAIRQGLA